MLNVANSLCFINAIWRQTYWYEVVQVILHRAASNADFIRSPNIIIYEIAFETTVGKILAILFKLPFSETIFEIQNTMIL